MNPLTMPKPNDLPRFAFIQSCWHDDIVNQGRDAYLSEMKRQGVARKAIDVLEVPGAFELPLLAKRLARSVNTQPSWPADLSLTAAFTATSLWLRQSSAA